MSKIITLQELNSFTGEDLDESKGAPFVDAVNAYIESETGRVWGEQSTATESYDWAPVVFLRHQDVVAVNEVSINGTLVDESTYRCNEVGRLVLSSVRSGFRTHRDDVSVAYTHGVAEVPADLKLAALSLASDFASYAADGQKEITSEGIGSMRLTYSSGKESATGSVHFSTINRYRTRNG